MSTISQIDADFIEASTNFPELVSVLAEAFARKETIAPLRHHHQYANPSVGTDSTLLLMPAWQAGQDLGVKVVTVSPENGKQGLPSIQGTYLYFNAINGQLQAIMEGKNLTAKRTAAASALAASFLARPDSSSLLMIGTGALAPNLIKAHASVRPIERVFVWGRNKEKAMSICAALKEEAFSCEPVASIVEKMNEVDIISCATLSPTPLVLGGYLRPGQHLDLVGSYQPTMREADNACVLRASIFVDIRAAAPLESGDLFLPLQQGVIETSDIRADLFELCSKQHHGRSKVEEITLFKSVGHALEDLAAANYFYQKFTHV